MNYDYLDIGEPTTNGYNFEGIDIDNLPLKTVETAAVKSKSNIDITKYSLRNVVVEARKLGPMQQLLGSLIYKGQLLFFAGKSGYGKSSILYQIAVELSRGNNVFELSNEVGKQIILYYDFELRPQQIAKRYQDDEYLSDTVYIKRGYEIYVKDESNFDAEYIKKDIELFHPDVIIIDNLSALMANGKDFQDVAAASVLMKKLNSLKEQFGITIIIAAHTTKIAKNQLLDINQMAGSSQLVNLTDGVLMLGRAADKTRYIKNMKGRDEEESDQVFTLIPSSDINYIYEPMGWKDENELINNAAEPSDNDKDLIDKFLYVFGKESNLKRSTLIEGLVKLGNTESNANNLINKAKRQNIITQNNDKLYNLTKNDNEPF